MLPRTTGRACVNTGCMNMTENQVFLVGACIGLRALGGLRNVSTYLFYVCGPTSAFAMAGDITSTYRQGQTLSVSSTYDWRWRHSPQAVHETH